MKSNIIKYRKSFQLNIGIVLCVIILIYVLFHLFTFLTKDNITAYEVSYGTISDHKEYQALAIRQEEVFYAPEDGYIYYFGANRSQVGVRTVIYSLDKNGAITDDMRNNTNSLDFSTANLSSVNSLISGYTFDYNDSDFHNVYTFKSDLGSTLSSVYSEQNITSHAQEIMEQAAANQFSLMKATTPGLLLYTLDGLESVTVDDFTEEDFVSSDFPAENLKEKTYVSTDEPIYKEVTSDIWYLVTPIDSETAQTLAEHNYLQITFHNDGQSVWAKSSVEERNGKQYLILRMDDSMERYADSRYLTIDLELNETSGLKIPTSSITSKEFFVIPSDYFLSASNSTDQGLMVRKNGSESYVAPTIYYETEDGKYYYIDSEKIDAGDVIVKPDSNETCKAGDRTDSLVGVYNINKGYAIFKQIKILYEDEDYALVETGTAYGISLYDHIALQGDSVEENDIISQ